MGNKIWYRFFKQPFDGVEPRYFDVSDKSWAKWIESKSPEIAEEVMSFVENNMPLLKDYRFHITNGKPQWQTFSLLSWGFMHKRHIEKLPVTWAAFRNVSGLVSVSVSRLIAGSILDAHHGDTNAIYRCHLGIKIPGVMPDCVFVVEGEEKEWQENKVMAFCDARNHFAQNLTSNDRYVIIFDIIREDYLLQKKIICATILVTHFYLLINMKVRFYDVTPRAILKCLVAIMLPFALLYIKLQNIFLKNEHSDF